MIYIQNRYVSNIVCHTFRIITRQRYNNSMTWATLISWFFSKKWLTVRFSTLFCHCRKSFDIFDYNWCRYDASMQFDCFLLRFFNWKYKVLLLIFNQNQEHKYTFFDTVEKKMCRACNHFAFLRLTYRWSCIFAASFSSEDVLRNLHRLQIQREGYKNQKFQANCYAQGFMDVRFESDRFCGCCPAAVRTAAP